MANVWVTVGYGVDGEEESGPIVGVFSSAEKAQAWAFSQTKTFENVHVFDVVVDGALSDQDWDDICTELF